MQDQHCFWSSLYILMWFFWWHFLAITTVVMRNCYVLQDIDALFFMVENMLSAVCSSASVTNII